MALFPIVFCKICEYMGPACISQAFPGGACNSADNCPKFLGLDKQTSSAKDCLTQHVKLKLASQRHEAAREVQQCRPYSQP